MLASRSLGSHSLMNPRPSVVSRRKSANSPGSAPSPSSSSSTASSSGLVHLASSLLVNSSIDKDQPSPATSAGSPVARLDKRRSSGASNDVERRKSAKLSAATDSVDDNMASPSPGPASPRMRRRRKKTRRHVDLAKYPTTQLLHYLAALLTQIASANDSLRLSSSASHIGSQHPPVSAASTVMTTGEQVNFDSIPAFPERPFTATANALKIPSTSLSFHARNIPTIGIEQYLGRILKCG
jgi:hypothetical protein